MMRFLQLFIPIVLFFACSSHQSSQNETATTSVKNTSTVQPIKDSLLTGKIIKKVICNNDAAQSYALYIPPTQNNAPMPVIYCFDPHGDGSLPLENYQALADAYHFILIGSNNSKNGNDWNITQNIWNTLFNDTQNRLPINNNRIYTCGFSGGAKVAGFIALHQGNIKGVIAAGAGLPEDQPIGNLAFSFTGMAGRGDMNMTDLIALNNELDKSGTTHRIILFNGKHAWPPANAMRIAFTGLQLDAMRNKITDKNDSLIQSFTAEMNKQIEQDIAAKKLIEAHQTYTLAINMLNGLTHTTNAFANKEKVITNNPLYSQQLQEAQQLFATAQRQKQIFQQQFQQGDIQYWISTINDLNAKAKASTATGAMYQRLLAYLSLAFYSISNQLIHNNQNEPAQYFVTLYKMADVTNPEAWYFSALLNARSNNAKEAEADLLKAAGYGFADTARMLQQPEFQTLSQQLNFILIESRMKKTE
ncbi:hypothetical protein FC093_13330 [Ilyomonas limi]|uniref:Uncharacterized protein n=1 Tax=Ilyomonas limi TaxID=2575867 RepID=A0A4U3L2I9_9BACT|nr:hypothetical protein [Ilyomonas limi]TKK67727.1 hypothetical protein FC093_13330 [Ilyomonas limi]